MSISVEHGSEGLIAAVQSVQATGVEIEDIALRHPNLDEVFMALTGQATDPDSQASSSRTVGARS